MAFLFNPATATYAEIYLNSFKAAVPSFAVEAIVAPVGGKSELEPVIATQARAPNGGLIVMPDPFMVAHRAEVTSLAARYRLPTSILDLAHDVVFSAVAALLAWRLGIGLMQKFENGESTLLIRVPFWWSYSFAVVSMILLCVVCIARIVAGLRTLRQ